MNNIDYFKYSQEHNDSVDEFVNPKGVKVISDSCESDSTKLMEKIEQLNDLITTYSTLVKSGKNIKDESVKNVVDNIAEILEKNKNKNINYSPFCVYFQVMRYSYNSYKENYKNMDLEEKRDLLVYLLNAYLENRYEMYKSHEYSHIILQVMADSSSSRRNGTIGLKMLASILNPLGFTECEDYNSFITNKYSYINSDKKGKKIFEEFISKNKINFEFRKSRDNKYPDMLIKVDDNYFILEHKLTNGGGGSQNAEINEIIDFTRYDEENEKYHYVSCLQGDFIQYLTEKSTQPKNIHQRTNIQNALKQHPNNYFVNGKALEKLIKDYMEKEK